MCLLEKIKLVQEKFPQGLVEAFIPQLDPISVETVDIELGKNQSIGLSLAIKNIEIVGFSKADFCNVSGFTENPKVIVLKAKIPKLTQIGDYSGEAKILTLRVNGHGKSNITLGKI